MDELTVLDSPADVAAAAAADIAEALSDGARTLVLAGGSTPQRCYELLAHMDIAWGRVSILFGDERCVPPDHPDSNFRVARLALLDKVFPGTVYRDAARAWPGGGGGVVRPILGVGGSLDVVTLGVGEDGHTASL